MSAKNLILVVLLLILLCCGGALAHAGAGSAGMAAFDWPQWRGPHRDAVSQETGLVDGWDEAGPKVLWRREGGEGFSSVSVSADRAYTLWDAQGKQFLVCLDVMAGKKLWTRELGPAFEHHYGNGPRSTPLVHDGVVYAIGTSGLVLAASKGTGETVWQRDLVKDFGADLPSYGYASSPLVVDDKLVVEAGGKEAAYVALDKKTGEIKWTSASDQPAYSSPIEIEVQGVSQVVFWSAHGLHSVASGDGTVLWNYSWETFCPVTGDPLNTGTPIFIPPDRIFLSSSSGAAVLRLSLHEGRFKVAEVWRSETMRSDVNTALLVGDHIYGFDRGTLKSLDVNTGAVGWMARGYQRGSLIAADDKLIVLSEDGRLALVNADPEKYVERASASVLKGRTWTSAALAAGKLFLRDQDEILCVDMEKHSVAR